MSIVISRESLNISRDNYSKIFSVDTKKNISLADFIKSVRGKKNLSTTDVERISRAGGRKGISNGYISQIENNYIQNVSPEKLRALALGLGITEEEIFAVARQAVVNTDRVVDERFENLRLKFSGVPSNNKERAEALVELLDRELERMINDK